MMADKWYPFSPHFNILSLETPYKISKNLALPKPVIATISNWLSVVEDPADEDNVEKSINMQAFVRDLQGQNNREVV